MHGAAVPPPLSRRTRAGGKFPETWRRIAAGADAPGTPATSIARRATVCLRQSLPALIFVLPTQQLNEHAPGHPLYVRTAGAPERMGRLSLGLAAALQTGRGAFTKTGTS